MEAVPQPPQVTLVLLQQQLLPPKDRVVSNSFEIIYLFPFTRYTEKVNRQVMIRSMFCAIQVLHVHVTQSYAQSHLFLNIPFPVDKVGSDVSLIPKVGCR